MENDAFFTESEERKFCLLVENRKLFVSKESMASMSPVFKRMLYGDFKEASENEATFKDRKLSEILDLLHVMFPVPEFRQSVNYENFETLMTLADEFDIRQLRRDGECFLQTEIYRLKIGNESVCKIAVLANRFWNAKIIEQCVPYVCALSESSFNKYKTQLSEKVLAAIYEAKFKRCFTVRHTGKLVQLWKNKVFIYECETCQSGNHCNYGHNSDCQFKGLVDQSAAAATACLCGYYFDEKLLA